MGCRPMPPAGTTEWLPLAGRGDQGPESRKTVRGYQAETGQLTQSLLHLGRKQPGDCRKLVEERGPALLEDVSHNRAVAGKLVIFPAVSGEPLIGVLSKEQRDRSRADRAGRAHLPPSPRFSPPPPPPH